MRFAFIFIAFGSFFHNARAQQHSDLDSAYYICQKQLYHIPGAWGEGRQPNETGVTPCFLNGESQGNAEKNSNWFVFSIRSAGDLAFRLSPDNRGDDLDFVVYRYDTLGQGGIWTIVRCMAAAASPWQRGNDCRGDTGLRAQEWDVEEDGGCRQLDDNNWLMPLTVKPDEVYALLVSNMTAARGFSLSLSGSARLACEE